MQIQELFDSSKSSRNIYRTIEKVITYAAAQEDRLKAEIGEYVVTDHMEEQFEDLLSKMQLAMEQGGENEVGVWVSGYYGSGKSSFTKYLGLALDGNVEVEGVPFLHHLRDRMNRAQTRALLSTVASRHQAAIVMLDLASEMVAGATMEDVSTVLYYKVLQWAGFSRNLKVAALERRLQKEGRFDEFAARVREDAGLAWPEVQNDPLVIDSLLPELAHELYPALFRTPTAFNTEAADYVTFENERVAEMIDIVREKSGKQYVVFIIDEVGQYVGSRDNLILNLDGLAKNLKNIGDGKVWVMATAQQTLAEDDPRAAINSPELYKLEARFPIQVDLEARDIKEICIKRLLGKSPSGAAALGDLYGRYGERLRHNIKLEDARFYDSDFDQTTFVDLYPFLPAHFDILLQLLGVLARAGGIGLRSAIKVIQDILIERTDERPPVAQQEIGHLVTAVTIYDALEKEIRNSKKHLSSHAGVSRVAIRFPDSTLHQHIAKTAAVLQILENIPITAQNIAALMHPEVESASRLSEVEEAIDDLVNDAMVPFGEKDGGFAFFSEKLNTIDQERMQIPLRTVETRRIQNEALRSLFTPLPSVRLHGSLSVTSGIRSAMGGSMATGLAGDRETVQTVIEFVNPGDYEAARARLVEESVQRGAGSTIFLLGRSEPAVGEMVGDIYRCREIAQRFRNDPDGEVREYCNSLTDRADRLSGDVQRRLERSLRQGSFIFRGQTVAVDTLAITLHEAARKQLSSVADQVFDRYDEAPVRAETGLAEKFLRIGNLNAVTAAIDPLGLVQIQAGTPRIDGDHRALISIRDYLDHFGSVEGRRLTDHFTSAPFGWSPDTLRYLVAALLLAGDIKLKISGREITAVGQQAIDALRTNRSFREIGVALRSEERPSMEVLARASTRLTEFTGEQVLPLEDAISKAAARCFTALQHRYGGLPERLEQLGLPGSDSVRDLNQSMADMLRDDASSAARQLGMAESSLYDGLHWADAVQRALQEGLAETIAALQRHRRELEALPATGTPAQLHSKLGEELELVAQRLGSDDFYAHTADLNTALRTIRARTRDAVTAMTADLSESIHAAQEDLRNLTDWSELDQQEQEEILSALDKLASSPSQNLEGLRMLFNQEYVVANTAAELRSHVRSLAHERRRQRLIEEEGLLRAGYGGGEKRSDETDGSNAMPTLPEPTRLQRSVHIPEVITSVEELDSIIRNLQKLRAELELHSAIDISITIADPEQVR